jgi:hypothetical protein
MLGQGIAVPALVIGSVTFILCLFSLEFGKRLRGAFGEWSEVLGGAALLAIGTKIFFERLARALRFPAWPRGCFYPLLTVFEAYKLELLEK